MVANPPKATKAIVGLQTAIPRKRDSNFASEDGLLLVESLNAFMAVKFLPNVRDEPRPQLARLLRKQET